MTKPCADHYPILGHWDVIESRNGYVTYQCPKCQETYVGKKAGVVEFTTDSIRQDRKKYEKELTQPYNPDGSFNKKFKQYYPEHSQGMIKEGAITQYQYDKAK